MTAEMTLPALEMGVLYRETLIACANGKSIKELTDNLLAKGVAETNARMIVEEAQKEKRAAFRRAGIEAMGKGGLYVLIGVVITALTFAMNLPIFIVACGPILFGGITFFKGLYRAIAG